jgi:rare lipoprotein A
MKRLLFVTCLTLGVACASAPAPAPASGRARAPGAAAPSDDPPSSGRAPFETGIASFYHPSLAGNQTANGERYEPDKQTCAHRTLPFGTDVEVKLLRTGATAVCRVNDRGPFAKNRVIDLSMGMAKALGVEGNDIHKVELYRAD